jgi:D-hydroxyproline dehydrogenase subunit alpha
MPNRGRMHVTVDGEERSVPDGASIAAALTENGQVSWRRTRRRAEPRGLSCGIGVCFDCLITVNGVRGVRACLADARPGDVISTEAGAPEPQAPTLRSQPAADAPRPADRAACDVAVVGAGPAGMSAAVTAADAGCSVVVFDLGERPGGQYWRWGRATADGRFHHGWRKFTALRGRFDAHQRSGRIAYLPGHAVYHLDPPRGDSPAQFLVSAVAGDRERAHAAATARAVVVATGAYDRQLPFPGWTLPGVMAAGAAQSLLKGSAVAAGRRVAVAGTGPFLLPVAAGLAGAGSRVVAVIEAGQPLDYLRSPAGLAASWRKLPEAAGYLAALARHRVPVLRRHAVIAAHGDGRVQSVTVSRLDERWAPVPGTQRTLGVDVLAAGYGFVPQAELLGEAGARLVPGPETGTLVAVAGPDQQTSVPGLFAAGETTGVGGADLACIEGVAAGRAAAACSGHAGSVDRPPPGGSPARADRALRRFSALMHSVHALQPGWARWPDDGTVVCRCEEVTLGQLRAASDLGADDARSAKLLARPGMGWCQGRMCGPAVTALLDELRPGEAAGGGGGEALAARPLAQPVPLGVLAAHACDGGDPDCGITETSRTQASASNLAESRPNPQTK